MAKKYLSHDVLTGLCKVIPCCFASRHRRPIHTLPLLYSEDVPQLCGATIGRQLKAGICRVGSLNTTINPFIAHGRVA